MVRLFGRALAIEQNHPSEDRGTVALCLLEHYSFLFRRR